MRKNNIFLAATASILLFSACSSDDTSSVDTASVDTASVDSVADTADTAVADSAGSDDAASDAPASNGAAIGIKDSRYDPTDIEIAVGESVTFTNNDGYDHTVTSKDDSTIEYDSGKFGEGETFEQTYDEAGSYSFFCEIHPTMRGTVTVV